MQRIPVLRRNSFCAFDATKSMPDKNLRARRQPVLLAKAGHHAAPARVSDASQLAVPLYLAAGSCYASVPSSPLCYDAALSASSASTGASPVLSAVSQTPSTGTANSFSSSSSSSNNGTKYYDDIGLVPDLDAEQADRFVASQSCQHAMSDLAGDQQQMRQAMRRAIGQHRVRTGAGLQSAIKSTCPAQVHMRGVSLATCVMDDATLQHSDFSHADLENASLRRSNISKTSFFAANLRNAVFDGATLSEIDFTAADLTGASFRDCDAHALTHNVAVYGACLHNVIWPNAAVATQMEKLATPCLCVNQT